MARTAGQRVELLLIDFNPRRQAKIVADEQDRSVKTRSICGASRRRARTDVSPSIFGVIVGSMEHSTPSCANARTPA